MYSLGISSYEAILSICVLLFIFLAYVKHNWIIGSIGFYIGFIIGVFTHQFSWDEAISGIVSLTLIILIADRIIKKNRIKKQERMDAYHSSDSFIESDMGKYGEYLIFDEIKNLQMIGAKFLFNVYVPKDNGQTTEIDSIVVSTHGIFVIESKNYSGWIFGTETDEYWTQTFPSGRKERFYNPITQNRNHCKYLSNYLGIEIQKMKSYIVFSNRCELRSVPGNTLSYSIVQRKDLLNCIREDMDNNGDVLSEDEINYIYNKLYSLTQVSNEVKQNHINNIHNSNF